MLANDLLSYSIMSNGEKAVVHALPHYASLDVKPKGISLPPIASYVSLTENNLNSLNSYLHKNSFSSTPPSLTSSSSASESPLASPRIATSSISDASSVRQASLMSSTATGSPQKKRRQRLGPSCDNCRSRKVKCNADVVMMSRHFTGENESTENENGDIEEYALLSSIQKQHVLAGEPVHIDGNYVLVLSNYKLIKYKPCMSCASKGFACCFSKGFTKEDIVHSKRHRSDETVPSKSESKPSVPSKVQKKPLSEGGASGGPHAKLSTRKSSCSACRKRKVKCVVTSAHGRCVGCTKKDISCAF